jgi:multidrug transporter EmrE-like cation transporter
VVVGAVALVVQLEAFRWAPVGFIEVVKRGVGMTSAVVLGRLAFGEPLDGRKLAAVALLTGGVALVVGLR